MLTRGRRSLRRLLQLVPHVPRYQSRGGGPVVAQAVVLRPGAGDSQEVLLLLRTSPRAWEFPGGAVERGELPEVAVVREVHEETGLDVRVERLLAWYRRTGFVPHRSPVYVCTVTGGTLRSNWESVRVQWFSVEELPRGLFPWYRPVIADAASGVTHAGEQEQHLGWRAVLAAAGIHARGILGW